MNDEGTKMSVFKCKMCGGTIEFEPGATVGVCDSCGVKQTLPRLDDDKKAALFDRANHYRRNNDFDKAMALYEQILNEDSTDAEAYWSIVLCRYGIEYVEDPASHKRIPTVNRTQFTSVFADEDYRSALQYADGSQRAIYQEEAKAIDDIQKGILEISQKEEPFDVFICYKETDENGRRTQDSVLANDLYHQLTQEGFKVFFSRITLEDKLGAAYEPYIFAALNSAKVMVALGTRPEFFNAVWVKNEWSRYLALIKNGAKKVLIPAYKDMDPYDLPEEFSHLQAQDMSKLGFMQDLIRGIRKITRADEPAKSREAGTGGENLAPLLKRAFFFLEDGAWQEADEYCEKVLDQDPENARAYLGKLMAEMCVRRQEDLNNCDEPFDNRSSYQKALRFADPDLANTLKGYIAHIQERNETARLESVYTRARDAMFAANTVGEYYEAACLFESIHAYKDAAALAEECREKAEGARKDAVLADGKANMTYETISNYESAIQRFETISGWKDADEQIAVCQQKIEEIKAKEEADRLERERQAEIAHQKAERNKKIAKRTAAIALPVVCAVVAFLMALNFVIIPSSKYNKALAFVDAERFDEAYDIFRELGDYKDSKTQLETIKQNLELKKLQNAAVGNIVTFGAYEQDNNSSNGKEDIEWQVLAREENRILMISKYGLDCRQYHSSDASVTWENCSLRQWLNTAFLSNAFSEAEQVAIATTTVSADANPEYGTNPGNSTQDRIFLLSIPEVNTYFPSNEARKCAPTEYAKAQDAYSSESETTGGAATCWWRLRSPGSNQSNAAFVNTDGTVIERGDAVYNYDDAIRPALWITLNS